MGVFTKNRNRNGILTRATTALITIQMVLTAQKITYVPFAKSTNGHLIEHLQNQTELHAMHKSILYNKDCVNDKKLQPSLLLTYDLFSL